jgi:hypothetical protein
VSPSFLLESRHHLSRSFALISEQALDVTLQLSCAPHPRPAQIEQVSESIECVLQWLAIDDQHARVIFWIASPGQPRPEDPQRARPYRHASAESLVQPAQHTLVGNAVDRRVAADQLGQSVQRQRGLAGPFPRSHDHDWISPIGVE